MFKFVILLGFLGCGIALPLIDVDIGTFIVGGDEAAPGEFPYIVQLQYRFSGSHMCGGAILNENWIVTAAHCVEDDPSEVSIVAGQYDLEYYEDSEQTRYIKTLYIHPYYGGSYDFIEYDIALIQLNRPLVFNNWVKSIPMHPQLFHETPVGTLAVIAGWGNLDEDGFYYSPVLNKVEISIVSREKCAQSYDAYDGTPILDSMICAGTSNGGKDSCQGDSGGPLVCSENGHEYLCGIVSFGVGCGRRRYPGVSTQVSYFTQWIADVIEDHY